MRYRSHLIAQVTFLGELVVANVPVSEVMVTQPVTVSPDTEVATALDTMKEKRISCLPVVFYGQSASSLLRINGQTKFVPVFNFISLT